MSKWGVLRARLKDHLGSYGIGVALTLAGFVVAYQFVAPAPPSTITMATGSPDGAYFRFATQYREVLGRHGINLDLVATAGSVENVSLLSAPESAVDLALVQGGVPATAASLVSLGSLYFEPLWVFHRADLPMDKLTDLRGRRVSVGSDGSGTQALSLNLLKANGIDEKVANLLPLPMQEAARGLLTGALDAMFLVGSATSPVVQAVAASPNVRIMDFQRAESYARRYRYLSVITLPEGALDLAADLPDHDVTLLATTANLVARPDLHPALVGLLLQAATEVHGSGGLFEATGQFPSPQFASFPLSDEARRYYRFGPPLLQRYLPFWAASLIDRLKIMLLPLVGLLLPLIRVMPPVYRWRVRSRIYRWYSKLQDVDPQLRDVDPGNTQRYLAELDRIEGEVTRIAVPLSYADELYNLRLHIDMVRRRLEQSAGMQSDSISQGGPR